MSALKHACARFLALFRRDALDREFDEDARAHLDLAVDEQVRRGTPAAEARRLAHVTFGAVEAAKDAHRDSRGLPWLEGLLYDLRFAARGLRRDRAFTLTAIAMLALAIGLNVTVFTIMEAMLFRGYPLVQRNDRLVYMRHRYPSGALGIPYADFEDWRAQAQAFEGMAFVRGRPITFRDGNGRPLDTQTWTVSVNAFGLLGVPPMLGRDFAPADEVAGAAPVAILNHRFWESRFGKRKEVVGSTVHINGELATIIGVMPERFDFPMPVDLWMPVVRTQEMAQRGPAAPQAFTVVGRLRDGAGSQKAHAELETINRRLAAAYPATNRGIVPTIATHSEMNSGADAAVTWGSLWAAAWFVLLIACANLANLALVRTMGRWREFSTRMALGASYWRIMRQMVVESLMLAGVAGALDWWITTWSVRTWETVTASQYQVLDYTVDSSTFAYLVAISFAAATLCALAPIGRVLSLARSDALKGAARGVTQGRRGKRLAAGLVAGQMALAMVLLSGAGVLVRSFVKIVSAETGVHNPEGILVGSMRLPSDKYPTPEMRVAYFDRLEERLGTIPGTGATSVSANIPVRGVPSRTFEIEGRPSPPGGEAVQFLSTGSGYFRVMGASTISGRDFNDGDHLTALPVAIVNQSFAARFWPDEQPIGQHLRTTNGNQPGAWRTVVGVVPNIMQGDPLRQQFKPLVYVPVRQAPAARAYFFVRTRVPADRLARSVRVEVQDLDPDVILEEFTTLDARFAFERDYMDPEHSELGKHAKVAPIFALIALLLSAVGLSAVIAHSVSQRTKEIGVRMAIGAGAKDVRRTILREGLTPVAMGLVVGLAASLAVNRVLQSQLVGVSPYDPFTMTSAPVVLIVVALLACQIPVRRALRIEPTVALRQD